jgi:hypothetical protein
VIYCEINYSGVQARFEEAGLKMKPRTPIYKTEKLPESSYRIAVGLYHKGVFQLKGAITSQMS